MGQRTPQTIGEELLDYRNSLEMEVEVNRGSDGWSAQSLVHCQTGEAIGTGAVDSGDGGTKLGR